MSPNIASYPNPHPPLSSAIFRVTKGEFQGQGETGMKRVHLIVFFAAASTCLLSAQDDPPGRVARLDYTYGSVSFRPADLDDWFPADFNRPLTTGDHVYVDTSGTAELQIGTGTLLVANRTTMDILNLDDSNAQFRLSSGTLLIRLRYLGDQDSFEVDTPNLAFTLLRAGLYRVDVNPDTNSTYVTVRAGDGELNGPDQAFTVHTGQRVQVAGGDQPSYQTFGLPPLDTLDNFSAQRAQREDQLVSARYCSRDMIGYEDLDRYGSWRSTPDYGMVWVPNGVATGWAPYHIGHWLWVDPWGWTWVDDAPWGFAPFHYGRWAYVGSYWAWVPGPVAQRPVYAPALVVWIGSGAIGGGVGWFALGPREVYVPAYQTTPAYLTRINVSNTVIVNNINITNINVTTVNYVNRAAPNAVVAVSHDAFVSARPVQSAAVAVNAQVARSAPVVAVAAVAPTRASIVPAAAPSAKVARPPAGVESKPVVAKKTPPPPPVPFAQKQAALAANAGKPLNRNQVQQIRQTQPPPVRPAVRQVQARAPAPNPPPARPNAQPQPPRTAPAAAPAAPAQAPQSAPRTIPQPQTREIAPTPQRTPPPAQPAQPREAAPASRSAPAPPQPREAAPAAQRPPTSPAQTKSAPPGGKNNPGKSNQQEKKERDTKDEDKK